MNNELRYIELCNNEEEREIVKRVNKLSEESWLWWQDLGSQIPFLIFVFIGSTIFRNHWVIKVIIIGYIIYGYKVRHDVYYFRNVIYPRLKGKYDK